MHRQRRRKLLQPGRFTRDESGSGTAREEARVLRGQSKILLYGPIMPRSPAPPASFICSKRRVSWWWFTVLLAALPLAAADGATNVAPGR